MDTDGKTFIEHWDWAAEKGIIKINTARSLSAAAKQVLKAAYPGEWEEIDVLEIDPNETASRFRNLRAKEYKPRTLQQYERRFKRALEYFSEYIEDPTKWKPIATRNRQISKRRGDSNEMEKNGSIFGNRIWDQRSDHNSSKLITYPFPLRDDVIVKMQLPLDLTIRDVDRLKAFMNTLVGSFEGGDSMDKD